MSSNDERLEAENKLLKTALNNSRYALRLVLETTKKSGVAAEPGVEPAKKYTLDDLENAYDEGALDAYNCADDIKSEDELGELWFSSDTLKEAREG